MEINSVFVWARFCVYLWIGVWVIRRQNDSWQSAYGLSSILRHLFSNAICLWSGRTLNRSGSIYELSINLFLYMSDSHSINANIPFAFNCSVYIWLKSCGSGLKSIPPIEGGKYALWSVFSSKPEPSAFMPLNGL